MYGRGPQVGFGPPIFPDVVKAIIVANCIVYLVQALGPAWFTGALALTPRAVWEHGAVWQIATYMWLHGRESVLHLLFNMFALWMFGSQVASAWGTRRFLRYYLICGIGAGALITAWPALLELLGIPSSYRSPTLGASGAVYGVLLAFSLLWPDRTIMLLFPPIPLRAIWFIPFLFFMEVVSGPANVSHVGHLGSASGMTQLLLAGAAPPHLVCSIAEWASADRYHPMTYPGGVFLKSFLEKYQPVKAGNELGVESCFTGVDAPGG